MLKYDIIKDAVYEAIPSSIVEQIILFGSQARGDSVEGSDTDVCVIIKFAKSLIVILRI